MRKTLVSVMAAATVAIGLMSVGGGTATAAPADIQPIVPISAPTGFNATVAGQPSGTPLVNLATSSNQTVNAVNLPSGVGLYVMHCQVPSNPRSAPTLCDLSTDAVNYLTATSAERTGVDLPVRINGEFYGMNPNPTGPVTAPASVNCRIMTMMEPPMPTCALYVLGAGKDSANPAYLRFWPTQFSPVRADRSTDTIRINGKTPNKKVSTLTQGVAVPFVVTTASGLTPSYFADNCTVKNGTVTGLTNTGLCNVTITTTGGRNFKPLVQHRVFKLA